MYTIAHTITVSIHTIFEGCNCCTLRSTCHNNYVKFSSLKYWQGVALIGDQDKFETDKQLQW